MPLNKFIGWSRADLETWRRNIQEARLTGQIITLETQGGVRTQFDPNKVDLDELLNDIQFAISQLEDADPNNPADANPYDQRPGITRPRFC